MDIIKDWTWHRRRLKDEKEREYQQQQKTPEQIEKEKKEREELMKWGDKVIKEKFSIAENMLIRGGYKREGKIYHNESIYHPDYDSYKAILSSDSDSFIAYGDGHLELITKYVLLVAQIINHDYIYSHDISVNVYLIPIPALYYDELEKLLRQKKELENQGITDTAVLYYIENLLRMEVLRKIELPQIFLILNVSDAIYLKNIENLAVSKEGD